MHVERVVYALNPIYDLHRLDAILAMNHALNKSMMVLKAVLGCYTFNEVGIARICQAMVPDIKPDALRKLVGVCKVIHTKALGDMAPLTAIVDISRVECRIMINASVVVGVEEALRL